MTTWTRHWRQWARPLSLATLSGVIGWFAFVAHRPVPLLDWFDLAIHETGHLVGFFLPKLAMFMAGSFAQIAFPLGVGLYFIIRRKDLSAGGFCVAWAGTSAWDVSVYVADAPVQALPLIGGGTHDWAYILGHYNAIGRSADLAGFIETTGAIAVLVGIVISLWPLWERPERAKSEPSYEVHRTPVAVREPREWPASVEGDPWNEKD